ncbi:MAG: SpoVR family protein [Ardenticatenales bacterium]|nr:SpoVR family protein [Ardenticatenales bacterium]
MPHVPKTLPADILRERDLIRAIAVDYGLDFFEVIYEMVDFQQMNEFAAYMGFPTRYPHWRWGMEYERMRKSYAYGLHKIYEMVINTDPCYAYLLESNELIDQKIVVAHVYAHSDFFKNNLWFGHTNRKMMDEMANHATRIWRIIDRIGYEEVEEFIDVCLSLENLIDQHAPYYGIPAARLESYQDIEVDMRRSTTPKLRVERDYMDSFINPPDVLRAEAEQRSETLRARVERFPAEPQRDVLHFLLENAPLERWQQDVLDIVRKEAYYFAPQGMTKTLNEGWACLTVGSSVYTANGLLRLGDIVDRRLTVQVADGEAQQSIYDWAKFEDRETVWIRTKRGLELEGSITHRIILPDGSWRRLDELVVGDKVQLGAGNNLWAKEYVQLDWQLRDRITLEEAAALADVDPATVVRYQRGEPGEYGDKLTALMEAYDVDLVKGKLKNRRQKVLVPTVVDESLASLLGHLIGDGHISEVKRTMGLTTGDEEHADRFVELVKHHFGLQARKKWHPNRWRVGFSSKHVEEFLKLYLGLKTGRAARIKEVPEVILRSPKSVVAAFLSAYFDCDAYAGEAGVILSTSSDKLGKMTQLLLLNFGILSTRYLKGDGGWNIQILGKSAKVFYEEIGFGLACKQEALRTYVEDRQWFCKQPWEDKIVAIERRRADVYDISVAETHRYAAQGFINHNSYWHTTIMTRSGVMTDAEVVDYADHHSGTVAMSPQRINPYKIGLELLRDIEERWNKGQFGKEWEECDDARARHAWDRKLGLGRKKIFEVRKVYNDVGFIDTFFTEDFCNRHQLFTYHYNERTGRYEIDSREFQAIKQRLLFMLTNFGQPTIQVQDANYENRGALLLRHRYEGVELKLDEARDTLKNLFALWKRPIYLESVIDDTARLLSFDGKEHMTKRIK